MSKTRLFSISEFPPTGNAFRALAGAKQGGAAFRVLVCERARSRRGGRAPVAILAAMLAK
jgi:hypothetical protein